MKTVMTKTLLAAALTAAMGVASSSAVAALFNPFNVTEASVPGTGGAPSSQLLSPFSVGKITGNYSEVVSLTSATAFSTSLYWDAGQYVDTAGSTVLTSYLGSLVASQYKMYALYQASGTYSTVGGITSFSFDPGVGSLYLWIDPLSNTKLLDPLSGLAAWTVSGVTGTDDYLIASGVTAYGSGTFNPACSGGINCGSFGATTDFALTASGVGYFTSPVPFYNVSMDSGQFNNFNPASATQSINGSMDVTFKVPEPESLALLGIGLLGLGLVRRGRKQA